MREKVLITGGAGFIGSNLARFLSNKGYDINILDNFVTGSPDNLKNIKNIKIYETDIREKKNVLKALEGVSSIFHLASVVSVLQTIKEPIESHNINVEAGVQLLELARQNKVKRVIFASSAAVYGNNPELPKKECVPYDPLSPYAVHKIVVENYLKLYNYLYGLETVVLRFFNIFGPFQSFNSSYASAIPKFFKQIKNGKDITIYGDGLQTRDFCYIKNVLNALYLAMVKDNICGETFNIGIGRQISVLDVVKAIYKHMKVDYNPLFIEQPSGEVRFSCADIKKAEEKLGYKVEVGFEEGLERTIDWYCSQEKK